MITPLTPSSGTVMSAVIVYDLFFVVSTAFSFSRFMPGVQRLRGAREQLRAAGDVGVEPFGRADVERQHVEARRLDEEQPLQLGELVGVLGGEVVGLGPVLLDVVELPHVVVEAVLGRQPRVLVLGDRGPAEVVDGAVADHLEVLGRVLLGGTRRRRSSTPC